MDISVRTIIPYKEVTLREDNTQIDTGFLDQEEQVRLALEFIRAGCDLLETQYYDESCLISDMLEAMEK